MVSMFCHRKLYQLTKYDFVENYKTTFIQYNRKERFIKCNKAIQYLNVFYFFNTMFSFTIVCKLYCFIYKAHNNLFLYEVRSNDKTFGLK